MENNEITILLVDDEPDILEFLGYNLEREGYKVITAKNGQKGLKMAREFKPHLIILDVMMPEMDGMEACSEIRKAPELDGVLIAFLTARGEDYSQIAGFNAGADDYITKPIKPKLFLSRIQALLRRRKEEPEKNGIIECKGFTIDKTRYVVVKDAVDYNLARKEFELLIYLVSCQDIAVSRDDIFLNVWGEDVVVGDRTIDVHIRRIREKLGIDSIKTIKGMGISLRSGDITLSPEKYLFLRFCDFPDGLFSFHLFLFWFRLRIYRCFYFFYLKFFHLCRLQLFNLGRFNFFPAGEKREVDQFILFLKIFQVFQLDLLKFTFNFQIDGTFIAIFKNNNRLLFIDPCNQFFYILQITQNMHFGERFFLFFIRFHKFFFKVN